MHKSLFKSLLLAALAVAALALAPHSIAQIVTSGMTGIVRNADGKTVSGATVTAVHTPTNASFRAVTNAEGRYNFRGLPAGGPYSVTTQAEGYNPNTVSDVTTELGSDISIDVTLHSDVVKLEQFVVSADKTALDAGAMGSGTVISSAQLGRKPTTDRTFADMVSASPLVTLRSTFGDREESQITAVGQNNRYNSFMIDGSSINDRLGLNATGLASFFNPLSLDTLEQLSVQVSPYNARLSGFTGAVINAVTKSGTNNFHGSLYYHYQGDSFGGIQLRGQNEREFVNSGRKFVPRLDRVTKGFTFHGPIWKDHLFFFVSYEKFNSVGFSRDARFAVQNANAATNEDALLARLAKYATDAGRSIDWGNPVSGSTNLPLNDKKILAKIDWQINQDHRMTLRHSQTEGELEQFGVFGGSSSSYRGSGSTINGGVTTTSDGHFYSQQRKEPSNQVQLFSQWTSDFKTEIKYATQKTEQKTPTNTTAPFLLIFGVSGTDLLNNSSTSNGVYAAGTEQFRHGNFVDSDTQEYSITGDYILNNFVFSGGYEHEMTDVLNVFRQGSYGLAAFRNLTDFFADTNFLIQRNVYDPSQRNVADISDYGKDSFFGQVQWNASPRLTLTGGLRYEVLLASKRPTFNQRFFNATGFRNDGSIDGAATLSPRVGFNWALDDERKTQLRGGFGHFAGRSPWVFFSNSFGATGVGSFTTFQSASSFTQYLRDQFDPSNPIGTGTDNPDNPALRRTIAFNDDKIKLPSTWRGSLAVDRKLAFLDSVLSVEYVYSKVDKALFLKNENLKPLANAVALDGRKRFSGDPASQATNVNGPIAPFGANALYPAYIDIYHAKNVSVGESRFLSVSWDRPMKNNWALGIAYTRGRSTEAQANGQTTADGYWQRNVVFNQGDVEEGTSDFEIKDRIQVTATRQFEFVKKWKTNVSLYYEGRTGNPYSWVFGGDLNGDGRSFNDTVFIPTGIDDARFDFSGLTSAQRDAFFATIQNTGLGAYAGGIAPKNSFTEPWVNRLDLKFTQDIPVYGSAKMQLFLDFVNFGAFLSRKTFGYTEIAPNLSNDVFRTRTLTSGTSYTADGRIRPLFTGSGPNSTFVPSGFNIDNGMSRWRIQVGAKIMF